MFPATGFTTSNPDLALTQHMKMQWYRNYGAGALDLFALLKLAKLGATGYEVIVFQDDCCPFPNNHSVILDEMFLCITSSNTV